MPLNGSRIRQARELKKWVQCDLAAAVGVSQSAIARLESGSLEPSRAVLREISEKTGFPERFFRESDLIDVPEGSFLRFRSRRSKLKARDRSYILALAQAAANLHEHLASHFRRFQLRVPHLDRDLPIDDAVSEARRVLGASSAEPIQRLVFLLEKAGFVCLSIPVGRLGDFDGFSAWVDRRPVIVLSAGLGTEGIRVTAAHELAHLCWPGAFNGRVASVEREAYAFGGRLLMPATGIRQEMPSPITISGLSDLRMRWGVSVKDLIVRAERLGLLSEEQYKGLLIRHRRLWPNGEPSAVGLPPERPRALAKMNEVVHGGSANKLAQETGYPVWMVAQILGAHGSKSDLRRSAADPGARVVRFPLPGRRVSSAKEEAG